MLSIKAVKVCLTFTNWCVHVWKDLSRYFNWMYKRPDQLRSIQVMSVRRACNTKCRSERRQAADPRVRWGSFHCSPPYLQVHYSFIRSASVFWGSHISPLLLLCATKYVATILLVVCIFSLRMNDIPTHIYISTLVYIKQIWLLVGPKGCFQFLLLLYTHNPLTVHVCRHYTGRRRGGVGKRRHIVLFVSVQYVWLF